MIVKREHIFQPASFVGLGLIAVLGGVAVLNPMLAVMSASMLFLFVLIVPRPILIVYGLVFLQPLVGGFARGAVIPFLRLGQAVLVAGFLLFLLAKPGRLRKFRLTVIDLAFVFFFLTEAVFPVLALLYRGEHLDLNSSGYYGSGTPLQTLLGPIQYYLLYRIVVATLSSERQIAMILRISFAVSIIVSIVGILQKLGVGPIRAFLDAYYPTENLSSLLYVTDTDLRITSTLEGYSGLAAYLCFTIILALACYTAQKRVNISRLLLAITLLLDSIALILTGTFAAIIGLAIGAVLVFKLSRTLPKLVIVVLIGAVVAVFLFQPFISDRLIEWLGGGTDQSLLPTYAERIRLWREIFLPTIAQNLLFGAGPAPETSNLWVSEESQYFALLLRGGLLYLFSYLLLIGVAMVTCWHQIKEKSANVSRLVAIATLAILVAMSFMNVSAVYFTYVGGTQTIWMLLAIVVASSQFKALDRSAAQQNQNGRQRMIGASSHKSSRSTVSELSVQRSVANEKHPAVPASQDTSSLKQEINKFTRQCQRFGRLKRLLDWHFVKDSVIVGAGSTFARMLGMVFSTLLAHFLTPNDFGFYRYAITLVGIATIPATASPASLARFLAANSKDAQARDRYFSNGLLGLAILLISSLLFTTPILWLMHALDFGTISCIIGLTVFYGYLAAVRGLGSAWKMGLTYALSNVALIIALFVVLGLFRLHTATAAVAIFGLTDFAPILVLELIRPMVLRFRPGLISKSVLLELARFATPIVIATGAYTIWFGIDVLLIQIFLPHEAGDYAVAKTVSGAFLFVPAAITMVLMPRVAVLEADKRKWYSMGAGAVAFLISLIGVGIVGVWGHQLIALLFGQRYSHAYPSLLVQSIGMSFFSIYAILEGLAIGCGRPRLAVQALGVALASTSITCFWLIFWFGALGASLSFALGAALGTAVMLLSTWLFLRSDEQASQSLSLNEQSGQLTE